MKKTFTLIELLVVVSIISVLIALLLPSLRNARELAKQSVCNSQEKQIFQCLTGYSMDYNGVWPALTEGGLFWYTALFPYAYESRAYNYANVRFSIFHCPVWTSGSSTNHGYGMNSRLVVQFHCTSSTDWAMICLARPIVSRISSPGVWPVAMDCDNWGSNSHLKNQIAFRHVKGDPYGKASVLYCDGHVESLDYSNYQITP